MDRYDQDMLLAYVEGELPPTQRARFEAQLAADPQLRRLAEQLLADREALRRLPEEEPPGDLLADAQQQLERQMLLGSPSDEAPLDAETVRVKRFRLGKVLVYSGVAAMLVLCAAVVVHTLTDNNLLEQAARYGDLALSEPEPAGEAAGLSEAAPSLNQTEATELAERPSEATGSDITPLARLSETPGAPLAPGTANGVTGVEPAPGADALADDDRLARAEPALRRDDQPNTDFPESAVAMRSPTDPARAAETARERERATGSGGGAAAGESPFALGQPDPPPTGHDSGYAAGDLALLGHATPDMALYAAPLRVEVRTVDVQRTKEMLFAWAAQNHVNVTYQLTPPDTPADRSNPTDRGDSTETAFDATGARSAPTDAGPPPAAASTGKLADVGARESSRQFAGKVPTEAQDSISLDARDRRANAPEPEAEPESPPESAPAGDAADTTPAPQAQVAQQLVLNVAPAQVPELVAHLNQYAGQRAVVRTEPAAVVPQGGQPPRNDTPADPRPGTALAPDPQGEMRRTTPTTPTDHAAHANAAANATIAESTAPPATPDAALSLYDHPAPAPTAPTGPTAPATAPPTPTTAPADRATDTDTVPTAFFDLGQILESQLPLPPTTPITPTPWHDGPALWVPIIIEPAPATDPTDVTPADQPPPHP